MNAQDLENIKKHTDLYSEALYTFLDKIVTLSAGTLALSITFRESIVGPKAAHVWLLGCSWVAFVVAVLAGTFWYLSKPRAHMEIASRIAQGERLIMAEPSGVFTILYHVAIVGFLVGIAALSSFAVLNLR
jgi:hypothetical protein